MSLTVLHQSDTHKIETAGRLPTAEEKARRWRDSELSTTDSLVSATDHPQHAAILTYRQALRDWPSTVDFPTTPPASPL